MKEIKKYIKNNKKITIAFISLILFIFITIAIYNDNIKYLDTLTHTYLINIRNNSLTNILLIITNIANAYTLIVLSFLLIIILKNKKTSLYISMNLVCAFITSQIAKLIFTRERPLGINLIEESGFSYPSGHSMVSMAYYGFIAYLIYKNYNHKSNKIILISLLILTIILIGFSRIYLGVHYLSDVIGGFLLAIVYLTIFIKIIKLEKKEEKWKQLELSPNTIPFI